MEKGNDLSTNEKLLEADTDWFENKNTQRWISAKGNQTELKEWLKKNYGTEEYCISQPFFFGIPEFTTQKPLIMVVGQETGLYGNIEELTSDTKEKIEKSQNWVIEVTKYLHNENYNPSWKNYDNEEKNIYIKMTPFFRFIKELTKEYNVCWNNLDKIHYTAIIKSVRVDKDIKNAEQEITENKVVTLYDKDEKELFKPNGEGQSLLQKEIDIVKPTRIIFVTGPTYKKSITYQMGNIFSNRKPDTDKNLIVMSDNKRYLWTYHPNYLSHSKNFDEVIKQIKDMK